MAIFYLWCLSKAEVRPRAIRFGAVPVAADHHLGWGRRREDDLHKQYAHAAREQ